MAIGQIIFAELPFACIGQPPYIERGWIKDCGKPIGWDKQDKAVNDWALVARTATDWSRPGKALTNWSVVDRAAGEWQQQDRNDVNTIGCGYVPSNIGGTK